MRSYKHGIILSVVLLSLITFSIGSPLSAKDKNQKKGQNGVTPSAEAVAEAAIITYGGRNALSLVKVNGIEKANVILPTTNGDKEGQLTTRFVRKETSAQDFKRIDLTIADGDSLSLGFNGVKIWATLNNLAIEPRPEAAKTFQASMIHNYDALLRYRENGVKLELKPNQTLKGLECYVVLMTHNDGSQTTFYVSLKTLHILHVEYETQLTGEKPSKFRISYYEFRTVQNVLVPFRTEIYEDDHLSQKISTTAVNYNIVMDDDVFNHA